MAPAETGGASLVVATGGARPSDRMNPLHEICRVARTARCVVRPSATVAIFAADGAIERSTRVEDDRIFGHGGGAGRLPGPQARMGLLRERKTGPEAIAAAASQSRSAATGLRLEAFGTAISALAASASPSLEVLSTQDAFGCSGDPEIWLLLAKRA
jgi:hypothetical protein